MTWAELEPLLLRDGIDRDAPAVFDQLRAVAASTNPTARRAALTAVVASLATNGNAARLVEALAASPDPRHRSLALELIARLPTPRPALGPLLGPLLRDRRISTKARLAAAIHSVQRASRAEADRVLRDFAAGYGKARFLERRAMLRKRFRHRKRLFDRCAARLAARVTLRCPRCGIKLPREGMARHLWDRHQLLLAGLRISSPWRLIDHWTSAAGSGPINAYRQLLRLVREDHDAVAALRRDAAARGAGLCPHCFAAVTLDPARFPTATQLPALDLSHGRLSGQGFIIELTNRLSGPRLRIETPAGVFYDGPEPNPPTSISMRRLLPGFLIFLALILAGTAGSIWALPATVFTLLAAAWLAVVLRRGEQDDRPDRVVDHAWRELVPHLHAGGFDPADADFVAALAIISQRHGDPLARARALQRTLAATEAGNAKRLARPAQLIALWRLRVLDAAVLEGDPVALLAAAIQPCFTGELTPLAADLQLAEDLFSGWTRGQRARLRVLLAGRAFAAGLGVWDLHALGRAAPGLARVLNTEDTDGLARLRLLWDLRPTRPWQHCGPAATVFELAKYPMLGGQHLEVVPDVLLFQPLPAGGEPIHLLACGRGLIVGGGLIHVWPTPILTRPLPGSKGGGYELRFGGHSIQVQGNAEDIVRKLEIWGGYFFEEFLPWIGNALAGSDGDGQRRLETLAVTCPECRTNFLARAGDLGRRNLAKSSRSSIPDSA